MAIASSPWAPVIALGGYRQVLLYHAQTLDPLGVLPFPEGTPYVLRFSRNGRLLLCGGGGLPDRGRRDAVKGGMTPLLYAARAEPPAAFDPLGSGTAPLGVLPTRTPDWAL